MPTMAPMNDGRFEWLPPGLSAGFTTRRNAPDGLPAAAGARTLAALLGAPHAETARGTQVHRAGLLVATAPPVRDADVVLGEGDAVLTRHAGRVVAVETADCVPILFADPGSGWIAALHAGWRGTAARIVDALLDRLEAEGAYTDRLHVFFGPSISREAYEVGPEVIEALARGRPGGLPRDAFRRGRGDRSFLDVAAVNEEDLFRRGVDPANIHRPPLCTASDPSDFPSYRRDGARTGRILSGIVRIAD